ncbi:hypothetical protein M409DRAFT_62789 [Zasmidium cellare ATCC 36951]|uniref:Nuclear pore complex protein n=1 Tax=Zasmidium cellare ATCC 36951 TaxID=1080233 RepID=A0A6A6D1B6_ZASCE|nr:uncharacterized protein M409DRAFT_62789 [Zasmidium cellare ATCC 36951]KAF2173217.1 hypothetical protein M409DRAFT_62789 [Zasmidium cellare ATCC 36951]
MAEQVGREAEMFAEKLDRFLDDHPTSDPTREKYEAILDLVEGFKGIAEDAVKSLQKNHERDVALQLRKEWNERHKLPTQSTALIPTTELGSEPPLSKDRAKKVQESRQWQQEADIWELFRIMLELHHNPDPDAVERARQHALDRLGNVHRYRGEEDVFSHFVLQNDLARERLMVKRWLEQTVDHQETDLSGISQELESKTSRGRGMWKNGWMHTREKIKSEKRTRSWSNAPGGPLPHIKRKDNTQLLVTTLDPDAASRQGRALEKEDEYFDRAVWITCWEMLRRGKNWGEVSDWCENQREGWRAMSLGMATDPADTLTKANWRHMCYLASQADTFGDYEAAVYGLLGGGVGALQKVCQKVDDKLYAYYNAALIRQFDQYLATHFPDRAPPARRGLGDDVLKDPQEQIVELIERLRKQPETSTEAIKPMKIIQSYLLANDVGSMIHTMGYAIAVTDSLRSDEDHLIVRLKPFWSGQGNQPEAEVALDPQTLRIATLMSIILAELRTGTLEQDERDAEDNVTVAYVQYLRDARNRDIIPLYVSRLSPTRRIVTMAGSLEDVKSPGEQEFMLSLMRKYDMDYIQILNTNLGYLLRRYMNPPLDSVTPFRLLEKTDDPLYPGQRVNLKAFPETYPTTDEAIVGALQWFNIIEGHWDQTFHSMSIALRKCLMAGSLACALRIVSEFPYDDLSKRKTYQVIGKSVNLATYGEFPEAEYDTWSTLASQAQSYHDLTHVVEVLKTFVYYRQQEAQYTEKAMKLSAAPLDLKEAKEQVDDFMELVLHGNLLTTPITEDEERGLEYIRKQYIPEILIAYNTVLHSAGAAISRENLIQSMDLSVTIANTEVLVEAVKKEGRMRELVDSFAETSKKMLILKAEGKPWRPRKDREGKDLGLWEIGPPQSFENNHEVSI